MHAGFQKRQSPVNHSSFFLDLQCHKICETCMSKVSSSNLRYTLVDAREFFHGTFTSH